MIIKQLSIFLENKVGRTNEVVQLLAKNGINILAFSIADGSEFGILRLIVSDNEKAFALLKAAPFAVMQTDVVSVNCPNTTGSLHKILDYLTQHEISVEYMYAFQNGDVSQAVIRPKDFEHSIQFLKNFGELGKL